MLHLEFGIHNFKIFFIIGLGDVGIEVKTLLESLSVTVGFLDT